MKSALLVMDFINEIVHKDGKIAAGGYSQFIEKHNTIKNTAELIKKAREKNVPVIFVKVGFSKDYKEIPPNSPLFAGVKENKIAQLDTWATEIHEDLDVQEQDLIVIKHRVNSFYSTRLEVFLKSLVVDTVVLAGVATNFVVESTAREAHDKDYNVIVVEDCCASATEEEHKASISTLSKLGKVVNSKDFDF